MLSASQIAGFLNQLFLQNKLMKQPHSFLCIKMHRVGMVKNECGKPGLVTGL